MNNRLEQEWESFKKSPFYWSTYFYNRGMRKGPDDDIVAFELFCNGWEACRQAVLDELKKDLHNTDLSTDSCDSRYIERIQQL